MKICDDKYCIGQITYIIIAVISLFLSLFKKDPLRLGALYTPKVRMFYIIFNIFFVIWSSAIFWLCITCQTYWSNILVFSPIIIIILFVILYKFFKRF